MSKLLLCVFTGISALTLLGYSLPAPAQTQEQETLQIPKSVQAEHKAIHATLIEAAHVQGKIGAAAKELAEVLHFHFVREEEIALPPLGLLGPLADGLEPPAGQLARALAMTDSLRRELPQMLGEHVRISKAVENLRAAAKAERSVQYEAFADQVALHLQHEEDVLYPAALLVGDLLRVRPRAG
jgi:hemerythrin HHE cation binding domain-containing protein